ncbi:PAQR family membrane homeostasis protein TrhA [Neisseria maigaei]|uniref:PAQR family membrane homeostasis protein TrhA n=1 Tax=Neisseria maigaei TaxID=2830651 RepID=UPI002657FD0F|nr:hemolysin III family protein [Neisseria maigaei]
MYAGERFNTYSHLSGLILAAAGLVLMLLKTIGHGDGYRIFSVSVYGISLLLLYLSSSLYHGIAAGKLKSILKKTDHCMIYVLIAGSYTPFALVSLRNGPGWTVFLLSWLLAAAGIAQELTIGRKSEKRLLSIAIYIVMGWMVLAVMKSLTASLPPAGLAWLATGGMLYSVGIYWFVNDEKIRHGHGIWHLFVLGGSITQFVSVYGYVI